MPNKIFPEHAYTLAAGKLLIAEPFLSDGNFFRTVILLCEHGEGGTVGFVLNRPTDIRMEMLFPDSHVGDLPVYQGGPVQLDTLCMLHRAPASVSGHEVIEGIWWGGSFMQLEEEVVEGKASRNDMQFYLGYSGWSAGQLEMEMESGAWLVGDATEELLFDTPREDLWRKSLESLGDSYKNLANLPLNPQLN